MSLAAILALLINAGALAYLGLQTRHLRNTNRFQVLEKVHELLDKAKRFPAGVEGFYALRHVFEATTDPVARNPAPGQKTYEASLVARIKVVRDDAAARERAREPVDGIVDAYNGVCDLIDNRLVDARPILATYHLAIVRELFIAEPFVWYRMLFEEPERRGMRPLRLGEMARAYNDMNPVHRSEIIFRRARSYGIILPKATPSAARRAWWWVRLRTIGYPTITSRSKIKQHELACRLRDALPGAKYPERKPGERPST